VALLSSIILALDVPDATTALSWARRVKQHVQIVKVGMRLFYAEGRELIHRLQDEGLDIFLDLKLYDIPNTVEEACESLLPLTPRFLTLHASGGVPMMQRAQAVFEGTSTQLLGVTCLTSFTSETLATVSPGGRDVSPDISQWVSQLAGAAQSAGLTGLVCSPHELASLREQFGQAFTLVTPGIRFASPELTAKDDDQARVMTPEVALQAGANYLVMGRPILTADDPIGVLDDLAGRLCV
jgi:orotidine-5'-phosphate decarboxylase